MFSFLTAFGRNAANSPDFNFKFENVEPSENLPAGWFQSGSGYSLTIDETEKSNGAKSILIETAGEKAENSFGSIARSFPDYYQGRDIELRGFLKLKDVSDGFAGLWMRIEGEGGLVQFENMQMPRLDGSADWTQYSIMLPLPEDGRKITIGVRLSGKGRLWAADFQVLIDGKDISEAKIRTPTAYKAQKDKEFDQGSGINAVRLDKSKIEDLAVLGKVWGFLKYHHPAVASGDYNWDYELLRTLPKILAAKNRTERNNLLAAWTEGLGTFETGVAEMPAAESIKLRPDLSWIDGRALGARLGGLLNRVRNAKRPNKHYYIGLFPDVGNPQFKNEQPYQSMKYPDAGFRLLSLFRYWNIIQYYFPYKHLIGEDWNGVLSEFIPVFARAAEELEYKKAALALIGRIHDTHANIWGGDETLAKFRGLNAPPVAVTFIEEKAVVTLFWDQALAEKSGLKIGDVIETINDRKVSDLVKERLDLTPASNYPTKLRDIARSLLRTNESFLNIKYHRGNAAGEIRLECFPKDKLKINEDRLFVRPIEGFKLIGAGIAYLYPGTLKPGEIARIIPQIAETKGLIVDLRTYPSDFIVFSLGEYLLPKPASFGKFSSGSVATPGLFTMTEELTVGKDNADFYTGKVVILVNEITQSQAEYTAMALRTAPRATVIGSTTSGADGDVSQFFLPGGIRTMISGIGVYYPDGRETQRAGIIPDLFIKPTIRGVAEGRDELLEKAIEIINGN